MKVETAFAMQRSADNHMAHSLHYLSLEQAIGVAKLCMHGLLP